MKIMVAVSLLSSHLVVVVDLIIDNGGIYAA